MYVHITPYSILNFLLGLINIATAEEAAEIIVSNMRRQAEIVFIPKRYYYISNLCRLLPTRIQWLVMDLLDSGIDPCYDNTDALN